MTATSSTPMDSENNGGLDAFGARLESCRERMRHLVRVHMHPLLQQRLDIDDVIQDIHLAAWQRLKQWEAGVSVPFFIWLRSIALQTIQNLYRFHFTAEKRSLLQERKPIRHLLAESGTDLQLPAPITSPSSCAIRQESHAVLLRTLMELSSDDREIISLRIFEELSNLESAEVLRISPKAASIRYVRAVDRLKRKMERLSENSRPSHE